MLCVLRQGQVLASTMPRAKTGQQKVQLYYEVDPLYPSSVGVRFIYMPRSVEVCKMYVNMYRT